MKKHQLTIYLDEKTIAELRAEAKRQDRPMSWLLRCASDLAKEELAKLPTLTQDDDL